MATWDESTTQTGTGHQTDAAPTPSHLAIAGYLNDGMMLWLTYAGAVSTGDGALRFGFPLAGRILGVSVTADTAPTGAALIVDIEKSGTLSLWATTPGNRPQIAAGANADSPFETAPDENNTFTAGQWFQVNVDQVGSTVAGSNVVVGVRYMWDV